MLEAITSLVAFITMVTEGLNRALTTMGWLPDLKQRKLLFFTVSILMGIALSLGVPDLAKEVFEDFYGLGDSVVGQIIFGVSLGLGSKVTYYLLDWMNLRRKVNRVEVIEKSTQTLNTPT